VSAAEGVHRPVWKEEEVNRIVAEIRAHEVTAVVSFHGIPTRQLQSIRAELKDVATIQVARITLIHRALKESGEMVLKLFDSIDGQTALIFTNLNPFKLFKLLEDSRTPAPARAGDIAPRDIVVEKGPTSFRPGPIVSDLQNAGIPAAIEKGKIVIRETRTVAKSGESITARLADVLDRLEIYPMEVGLYLQAAYDGDIIYTPEDLHIDKKACFEQLVQAVSNALNLSISAEYPTSLTVAPLLQKGSHEAMSLALEAQVFEPEVIQMLLARAQRAALALIYELPADALDKELIALKGTAAVQAASDTQAHKKEKEREQTEEKKNEKEESESGMAGLGALFE
jgi:large subunit ribosomal protein L10